MRHLLQGFSSFSWLDTVEQWAQILVGDGFGGEMEDEGSETELDVCHVIRVGMGRVPVEDEAVDSSFISRPCSVRDVDWVC